MLCLCLLFYLKLTDLVRCMQGFLCLRCVNLVRLSFSFLCGSLCILVQLSTSHLCTRHARDRNANTSITDVLFWHAESNDLTQSWHNELVQWIFHIPFSISHFPFPIFHFSLSIFTIFFSLFNSYKKRDGKIKSLPSPWFLFWTLFHGLTERENPDGPYPFLNHSRDYCLFLL